jgi:soluble lytic murein transglycosylase-like protein
MSEPIKHNFSWPYPRGIEYKLVFDEAELANKIPRGLLPRVAWQESRFKAGVISGQEVSNAGAVGIMQIVPKWHPHVNPFDPVASINYAASYLSELHKLFGTWELALAAYNWGPGNMMHYVYDHTKWPVETSTYTREILADAFEILATSTY